MTQQPTAAPPRAVALPAPAPAASPALPAGPAAAPTPGAAPARGVRAWVGRTFEGTPGRMRLLAAVAAFAAAVFGIVGAANLWSVAGALDRAGLSTTQVVRVQSIYSDILRADADATNAFLVGGLEDPTQRADYEAAMERVATSVAEAAKAQPADGTALAALNASVQTYAGTIEQARAYNRQGLPIGAQYLKNASTTLRADALPIVDAVATANTDRAESEFTNAANALALVGVGVLSLAALGLVAVWLARATHRYVNVPLTAGIAAVLVAFIVGAVVVTGVSRDIGAVRDNQFAGTLALATARSAAFDAKSNESLGLIARGQAKAYEDAWKSRDAQVRAQLTNVGNTRWYGGSGGSSQQLTTAWAAYADAHNGVRKLDDGGDWNGAVALATDPGQGKPRALFADFDSKLGQALDGYQQAMTSDVTAPRGRVIVTAVLLLLVGLASAWLALRGVSQRVEEYR
ncbi:MAG: hypothetical protein ACOYBY_11800 [Dermatophilaceae bacterium]